MGYALDSGKCNQHIFSAKHSKGENVYPGARHLFYFSLLYMRLSYCTLSNNSVCTMLISYFIIQQNCSITAEHMLVRLLLSALGENYTVHGVSYTTKKIAKRGSVCLTVISLGIRLLKKYCIDSIISINTHKCLLCKIFFTSLLSAFLLACIFIVGVYFGKASLKRPFLKLLNLLCFWFNAVIRFFC